MTLDPMPSRAELLALAARRGAIVQNATPEPRKGVRDSPYRSKWEAAYATRLEHLRIAGLVRSWEYETRKLTIGVGARYTPDFVVKLPDGRIEFHEVKGYKREAAMVRIRAAALRYPEFRFILVTKKDGQWTHTPIR